MTFREVNNTFVYREDTKFLSLSTKCNNDVDYTKINMITSTYFNKENLHNKEINATDLACEIIKDKYIYNILHENKSKLNDESLPLLLDYENYYYINDYKKYGNFLETYIFYKIINRMNDSTYDYIKNEKLKNMVLNNNNDIHEKYTLDDNVIKHIDNFLDKRDLNNVKIKGKIKCKYITGEYDLIIGNELIDIKSGLDDYEYFFTQLLLYAVLYNIENIDEKVNKITVLNPVINKSYSININNELIDDIKIYLEKELKLI